MIILPFYILKMIIYHNPCAGNPVFLINQYHDRWIKQQIYRRFTADDFPRLYPYIPILYHNEMQQISGNANYTHCLRCQEDGEEPSEAAGAGASRDPRLGRCVADATLTTGGVDNSLSYTLW